MYTLAQLSKASLQAGRQLYGNRLVWEEPTEIEKKTISELLAEVERDTGERNKDFIGWNWTYEYWFTPDGKGYDVNEYPNIWLLQKAGICGKAAYIYSATTSSIVEITIDIVEPE